MSVFRIAPGDLVKCVATTALYRTFEPTRTSTSLARRDWPYDTATSDVRRNTVFLVVAAIVYPEFIDNRRTAFEPDPEDTYRDVQALFLSTGHRFGWAYGEYFEAVA